MKMMNDMMKMNGEMNDMGMKMSLNKMDMNAVMYPEISGEDESAKTEDHSMHNMESMKVDDMEMSSDLQKAELRLIRMLNLHRKTFTKRCAVKDSSEYRKHEPLCLEFRQ